MFGKFATTISGKSGRRAASRSRIDGSPVSVARDNLLREIERDARQTAGLTGRRSFAPQVMEALASVPRHEFVRSGDRDNAYLNRARPIGDGQTISQPLIVALMTDLLDLEPDHRVLEIGTGSGYQTAVLSLLAGEVYTVETISRLFETAKDRLNRLGYERIRFNVGDGRRGWPEKAPFDAVIVTAAADEIPDALVTQLKPGGRMMIPVGPPAGSQSLILATKNRSGAIDRKSVLPVAFVPLVRG